MKILRGNVATRTVNVGSKSEHEGCVLETEDGSAVPIWWWGESNPFCYDTLLPYVGRICDVTGYFQQGVFVVTTIEVVPRK